MTSTLPIEVLDLRHFSARQMRPLLEEESREWSSRLRWDYNSSVDLLLQYLDSRVLPGFVALDRGRVCGYVFCVYEATKAVIGDVYATATNGGQTPAPEVESCLLRHLLEMLQNSPNVDRIESQLLLHSAGIHTEPFRKRNFRIYPRLFMECDLRNPVLYPPFATAVEPDVELRKWVADDFQAAGELIHYSYLGHLDSRINNQYRTLAGSLRFLHNIVRFPGCGVFDADGSWVVQNRRTGALEGLLLSSKVRDDVAHITQICVAPMHRGVGLGGRLLRHCIATLQARNFSAITLTVTESNRTAVRLYEHFGFTVRHTFDAMVWDPSDGERQGEQ